MSLLKARLNVTSVQLWKPLTELVGNKNLSLKIPKKLKDIPAIPINTLLAEVRAIQKPKYRLDSNIIYYAVAGCVLLALMCVTLLCIHKRCTGNYCPKQCQRRKTSSGNEQANTPLMPSAPLNNQTDREFVVKYQVPSKNGERTENAEVMTLSSPSPDTETRLYPAI